jgi:hypothetical protein
MGVLAMLAALLTGLPTLGCMTCGSGVEQREEREVAAFTEIEVGGIFEVRVEIGPQTRIEVVGDDNIVPKVTTDVEGGILRVASEANLSPKRGILVLIETPQLDRVDSSGASKIQVEGLKGTRFQLEGSGTTDVSLTGTVDTLELEISGTGAVDAFGLRARHVDVDSSGAGRADVQATDTLSADISGAASVRYRGNPSQVRKSVTGAGSIEPAE